MYRTVSRPAQKRNCAPDSGDCAPNCIAVYCLKVIQLMMLHHWETPLAVGQFGCFARLLRSHRPMGAQSPESGDCAVQVAVLRRPGDCAVHIYMN